MNKIAIIGVSAAALMMTACSQVHPGHVGIKVNQYGSGAGVEENSLGIGTYFTPPGSQIFEYPIFTQTYTYSESSTEGKDHINEEFNFQDKNGVALSSDIGVSYSTNPTLASTLYKKFRVPADALVDGQIRNAIRNSLVNHAATMDVEEIYGPKKQELLQEVQNDVAAYFKPYGLNVEKLFWAGNVRVPDVILKQINNKIANEQEALAAQAQVATVEAEARQKVAEAEGDAKAMQVQGDALRANPEMTKLIEAKKWDGHLPQVMSGATPFIDLK